MAGHRIIRSGKGAPPTGGGTSKQPPSWFRAIPWPPLFGMFSKKQPPVKPSQ